MVGGFLVNEKVLVEHGFDFVFGRSRFLSEFLRPADVAEDVEGGPLGATAVLA